MYKENNSGQFKIICREGHIYILGVFSIASLRVFPDVFTLFAPKYRSCFEISLICPDVNARMCQNYSATFGIEYI